MNALSFLFLTLFMNALSFSLASLARDLAILLVFSNNQVLALLILFSIVFSPMNFFYPYYFLPSTFFFFPPATLFNFLSSMLSSQIFRLYSFFFWLRWVLAAVCRLSFSCGAQASHCGGFSYCRAWALGVWASVVVAHGLSSCGSRALEHRLSSCGTRA